MAHLELGKKHLSIVDSLTIVNAPHSKGLEAIRKIGPTFFFTFEQDISATTTAFVTKGRLENDKTIRISKTHQIEGLPTNKGLEGLSLSADRQTLWVAHETMARPKLGMDSIKILRFDTNLALLQEENWYDLEPKSFFQGNEEAYDDYGVTELFMAGDSCYVLERGWGKNKGTASLYISLFKVSTHTWKKSAPLYRFVSSRAYVECLDNFEGLCYVPSLKKLLFISDDNRRPGRQRTIARLLEP